MGKAITNDLSWSVSRAALFQTCQRAYYFHYYGSWGGWDKRATDICRTLYMLKQMKTLAMWAGTIVHDTIRETLTSYAAATIAFPDTAMLQNLAVEKLRAGWREAVKKTYLESPKATNLFELYYGNGLTLPREVTDALKARVLECMENFSMSPAVAKIKSTPFAQWRPIDVLDSFELDGLKVWAAPDFAYSDSDGFFHIIDWKTGSENRENLRLQLACYALFAMQKWSVGLEQIVLEGVFLRDGGRVSPYSISQESLSVAKEQIQRSAAAMASKITDKEKNLVDEEACPCSPTPEHCSNCFFRQVCPAIN